MPCIAQISTKQPRRALVFAVVSSLLSLTAEAQVTATLSAQGGMSDPVVRQALDRAFAMDYAGAETLILQGLPAGSPARPYFAGGISLNRFLDWGDTAALSRAEAYWDRLSPLGDPDPAFKTIDPADLALYRGLTGFQLSYAASLRGQRLRPAALALAARQQLLSLGRPEARASLMLYAYYRSQILDKLPFVREADFPSAEYRKAAEASPALRDMFLSSLFWILLDKGVRETEAGDARNGNENLAAALRISEELLGRYPANRILREMHGSALYRSHRYAEARAEYESLREEYAGLKKPGRLPLGYYRATGNLARVYAALGMRAEASSSMAEWKKAESSAAGSWLPESLKRDLAKWPKVSP